jgi:type I restriction enzyme S subunit
VGVIPDDWDVKCLGEVARFRTGPFGSALHKEDYTDNGIPIVNPMHIVDAAIVPTHEMSITAHRATELADFRLRQGDIVIGRRGEMGRCAVVAADQDGWLCGTGSMIVRANQGYSAEFLQLVLSSKPVIASIENASVGSTMINLNQGVLNGLKVALPSNKEEQHAIATSIKAVGSQVEALQALITKKRQLKQAAMQELLTGKRRLPRFEGEWEEVQLGDIAAIRNAKTVASSMPAETQCVELECIEQGSGRLLMTNHPTGETTKYTFKKGDVLFGRLRAYLRKFWFASFDGVCSTEIWPLIALDERLSAGFLHLLVQTNDFIDAACISYGTHMPRSDWAVLRKFQVKLPPRPEQDAIGTVIADIDAELSDLVQRSQKAACLKQGMMQQLLTGKIRLT